MVLSVDVLLHSSSKSGTIVHARLIGGRPSQGNIPLGGFVFDLETVFRGTLPRSAVFV